MMRFAMVSGVTMLAALLCFCTSSCTQPQPDTAPAAPTEQPATPAAPESSAAPGDLARARLHVAGDNPVVAKAAEMLREEIEKRSGIALPHADAPGDAAAPTIVLGLVDTFADTPAARAVPDSPEAYAIAFDGADLHLVGRDARGALLAAGRLIRAARLAPGTFEVDAALSVATAPAYPMRGHQLGYRNTANSYDAWDVATYEQYVRDCVIFGANAVELIPTLNEKEIDGPVMARPQRAMNLDLSRMLDSYGLDVWIWLPLDEDVTDPAQYRQALEARDALFAAYPAVSHVMVPGGDPGHTAPDVLMPWLADLAQVMRKHFPDAGLWVSNQGFSHEQNDVFFQYLQDEQPDWLTGVVFGPWAKVSIDEMRKRTPDRYPVRRYPDITHNVRCQYPVPDWDQAFAQTIGRECANPRPRGTSHIHNLFAPLSNGFVSYSDGCHDDLNKMIWTALGCDPDADVKAIVHDYARVFFGEAYADDGAAGLWMLEENWVGSVLENEGIDKTLAHWQALEKRAGDDLAGNWRFQLYLLRAICDAYIRARLIAETQEEQEMLAEIAAVRGPNAARAAAALHKAFSEKAPPAVRADLRQRIDELCLAMHESIGMQYSVLPPYLASNPERGAILDGIDLPLNNRLWLTKQVADIAEIADDAERDARIERVLNWETPAPGALYDNLGCAWKQPHLVHQTTWDKDPGFVHGPQSEHARGQSNDTRLFTTDRLSWLCQAQTLFDTPLKMRYENLDPAKTYTLRVTYAGRFRATTRLEANDSYEVHAPIAQPSPIGPLDFALPRELTQDGTLDLEWQLVDGRGCQVAELWLIPE